jgi:eukaryotic-like serine/threonine-protein kinase
MGEYRLLRLLGQGAFGAVYLAEHVHDGSVAAIKLLQIQLTQPEDFKAFLNEARTIRLRHPHIVPLLDFGLSSENQPFLVMEYAAGGTLRDRHARGSRLRLPTLVSYVQQVASALQYAHERRVIHRDVKPENMLLRADGTLLLRHGEWNRFAIHRRSPAPMINGRLVREYFPLYTFDGLRTGFTDTR